MPAGHNKTHIKNLLRQYGFGLASLENSLYSTELSPNLITQDTIVPYKAEEGKVKLNELKLHALPWPAEVLQTLGGTQVEMRITLSYFIEPNPSRRGWQSKFRYQSHGLRFAVKSATETEEDFNLRINKIERELAEVEIDESMPDPDRNDWVIGSQLRARGSLHSDIWRGTAQALANKSHVAIFPVGGWWKDWQGSDRADLAVRYCLIVSIHPYDEIAADVDLYSPSRPKLRLQVAFLPRISLHRGDARQAA